VKPARFEYVAAASVDEAVSALGAGGDEAKVLAGGQSLVPLLNMRLARPALLVDVNPIPGLDGIYADGRLELGALVRQSDALASSGAAEAAPLLHAALRHVGHPATRSRGTIGGSVAHADPAAELPAALLALDAEVVATGPSGERTVPAEELFLGPFTTSLAPDELLTTVRVPVQGSRRFGFAELTRRHGDFALAGAAVLLNPARIVLFGVGGVPVRALEAERALDEGAGAAEVADIATRGLDEPVSDIHADAGYRRRAAAVLVRRALEQEEACGD
jgi:aerobic carbon-monoxide dehydrogenase medium subunit